MRQVIPTSLCLKWMMTALDIMKFNESYNIAYHGDIFHNHAHHQSLLFSASFSLAWDPPSMVTAHLFSLALEATLARGNLSIPTLEVYSCWNLPTLLKLNHHSVEACNSYSPCSPCCSTYYLLDATFR